MFHNMDRQTFVTYLVPHYHGLTQIHETGSLFQMVLSTCLAKTVQIQKKLCALAKQVLSHKWKTDPSSWVDFL